MDTRNNQTKTELLEAISKMKNKHAHWSHLVMTSKSGSFAKRRYNDELQKCSNYLITLNQALHDLNKHLSKTQKVEQKHD